LVGQTTTKNRGVQLIMQSAVTDWLTAQGLDYTSDKSQPQGINDLDRWTVARLLSPDVTITVGI
jgi:hypothetical protein